MKFCISNIAWTASDNDTMYQHMKALRFKHLELAPFIFHPKLFELKSNELKDLKKRLISKEIIPYSMQSILFGTKDLHLFNDQKSRMNLKKHLLKTLDISSELEIKNVVFGSPKNRLIPKELTKSQAIEIALEFFKEVGDYAHKKGAIFSLEPNSTTYGANFLTTTTDTIDFIELLNNPGIKLNLDLSTIILEKECIKETVGKASKYINHVHCSIPHLAPINSDSFFLEQKKLCNALRENNYDKCISIEMKNPYSINKTLEAMSFIASLYGSKNES